MGTYPDCPTYVLETGEDLQDVIDKHQQELVGETVLNKFGHSKIPYLPKILSIAKALPLQLHPNKEMAAKLHKENPDAFTDPNHKPEIALALGKFEAFCGFKPSEQIERLMQLAPLKQFLPSGSSKIDNDTLREVVRSMLKAEESTVEKSVGELEKLSDSDLKEDAYIKGLIPRLIDQYGKTDNGLLVALITMNFLVLEAGECISIPADGIHAYLSGDIIECMARSNNVLNTGFCPRGDRNSADLFCKCLTFKPHNREDCIVEPEKYSGSKSGETLLFHPPMNEFNVLCTKLKASDSDTIAPIDGPAISVVTSGGATMKVKGQTYDLKEGTVWFIAPGTEFEFEGKSSDSVIYTAYADAGT